MKIIIAANENQQQALSTGNPETGHTIEWVRDAAALSSFHDADAVVDLLFQNDQGRLELLTPFLPRTVVVSSLVETTAALHPSIVRINGWASFLSGSIVEAAGASGQRAGAEAVFAALGKSIEWLPDLPGFVSARVVCAIINEAYLSLEESVSSREEMNTAMKLGTNYPKGPFEWADAIGIDRVTALLKALAAEAPRYAPSRLLLQEAAAL